MDSKVRVRFAPSPTGGLHLGGVRTVLFNYLFAKHHGGEFIVRIEDTDQSRFVPGAEQYILDTLNWCGLTPDESTVHGGAYGPYRQSERKATYNQYAQILIEKGFAYYAFDTPEELEEKRKQVPNFQYSRAHRMEMKNSISLSENEVTELLKKGTPHVIRIKVPDEEDIVFTDMIRGEVRFDVSTVDDKVLLKADGMPTYHLAVVVDDYLMKITHAFRGEEWLPSAPVHILLWKYLFGLDKMPMWAHLPLILKPEGSGKLSKRDGERLGFPVFAMDWSDPNTKETTIGFKEKGFLPEAFINFLALLGWNDGTYKELFSLDELIASFDIERVHKGGAKFDYEKAKWFNQEWIKRTDNKVLATLLQPFLDTAKIEIHEAPYLVKVIGLVKDRCHLLADFIPQSHFFFAAPSSIDIAAILPKWEEKKQVFFEALVKSYAQHITDGVKKIPAAKLEANFKELATTHEIKPGELLLPLRIMLVGGKFGPGVFEIIESIELSDTVARIEHSLQLISGK
ncbi:MAG: glutamate--tRNA ligase [Sediminibacterium sp.]|nr:MAG: glutamate--tRNA ligase [Sediminibacterium sp.]